MSRDVQVRVIMTEGAVRFVQPLTFEGITGEQVATSIWDERPGALRMGHLDMARWADLVIVAPASASSIARLARGLADDLLGAVALSTRAPILIAPAMETGMWTHPATQNHINTLRRRGVIVVGPVDGRLASGASGTGRMAEPADIATHARSLLDMRRDLTGLRVLVTAGPTHEPIDPVRYIGNRSSGKMGYAVASEAVARGAHVLLVTGPTALGDPPGATVEHVQTASEMERCVLHHASQHDVIVMAAAVADYTPVTVQTEKIKRTGTLSLELHSTSDIAAAAARAAPGALHVGFALETGDLVPAATEKMRRKGQHLVVANALSTDHNPFGSDRNAVTLVRAGGATSLEPMAKWEVARALWNEIRRMLDSRDAP
ncbi:MAG: bifunctional phosphopantothenoylcysteine decarboxylase/phosphopantothenate--cysteine ligase CoaBC [Chloroflexota bacterium]